MSANPNLKSLVYAHNAAKSRSAMSKKTMINNISIGKYSQSIPMMEIAPTQETQWKKI